jgi:hypothetical protein
MRIQHASRGWKPERKQSVARLVSPTGIDRRTFLAGLSTAGVVALAGCTTALPGSGDTGELGDGLVPDGSAGSAGSGSGDGRASPLTTERTTLSGGSPGSGFGSTVVADGDTAIVTSPRDVNSGGRPLGMAHVFVRSDGDWVEEATLDDLDSPLGWAVSLDGDTAFVGYPYWNNSPGYEAGFVAEFTRSGGGWTRTATLAPDDGEYGDQFGSAVAADGDRVVVGAHFDKGPDGRASGAAYVFTRSAGGWTQETKLTLDDDATAFHFGETVALDGDTVLVGAPVSDDYGPDGAVGGSVFVFTASGGQWAQQATLTADDSRQYDSFAWSMSISGDTVLVGAPGDEHPNGYDAGSAYVFTRTDGRWTRQAKLVPDDGDTEDLFGWSVSLSGDAAVVGAPGDEHPNGHEAGSAYTFERSNGQWVQQSKLAASDGREEGYFGQTVAIDGEGVVIGAARDERAGGIGSETVYVFE